MSDMKRSTNNFGTRVESNARELYRTIFLSLKSFLSLHFRTLKSCLKRRVKSWKKNSRKQTQNRGDVSDNILTDGFWRTKKPQTFLAHFVFCLSKSFEAVTLFLKTWETQQVLTKAFRCYGMLSERF